MIKRAAPAFLCIVLVMLCLLPAAAAANGHSDPKVVRVGWYETPFNHKDALDRRTGYAYEYQRKIAAYTGWKYEYVESTWPELLQMLQDGRIDLMSDISYTEERVRNMLYADIPMGQEIYFLFISPDNRDISSDSYSSLNGKKVGSTRNSIQSDLMLRWAEAHGAEIEPVSLDCTEAESIRMLNEGEIDAFVTLDTYGDPSSAVPVWKIGSSDFYFAVSKDRPDLLAELNAAPSRIQDENKHYAEQLNEKYLSTSGTNLYLTADEREWLEAHGPIRVGYQDNYLAFCAADRTTGKLTGALKDYLDYASGVLENASPEFEAVSYPTAAAAMEALRNGEIDCMFPANLTDYDAEQAGVVMSPPIMRTEMDAVVREADRQDFLRSGQVRVGVNQGNPNYEMFLREHFPSWTPVYHTDTAACLEAVAAGKADCVIISNYRFRDIARQCSRLRLTTVDTGIDMDYCFAVREGSPVLYSILARMIGNVPDSAVNAALTYYSAEISRPGIWDTILAYPVPAALSAAAILVLVFFAVRGIRASGKKTR